MRVKFHPSLLTEEREAKNQGLIQVSLKWSPIEEREAQLALIGGVGSAGQGMQFSKIPKKVKVLPSPYSQFQ